MVPRGAERAAQGTGQQQQGPWMLQRGPQEPQESRGPEQGAGGANPEPAEGASRRQCSWSRRHMNHWGENRNLGGVPPAPQEPWRGAASAIGTSEGPMGGTAATEGTGEPQENGEAAAAGSASTGTRCAAADMGTIGCVAADMATTGGAARSGNLGTRGIWPL